MPTIDSFSGPHRFLSNFFETPSGSELLTPSRMLVGPTVEHVFQAAKTLVPEEQDAVLAARTAGSAKRLGRAVTLRPDWEPIKIGVMARILEEKFTPPAMADLLLATGDAKLVEGNHWGDRFWGVDAASGVGQNWLGTLLMVERSKIASTR